MASYTCAFVLKFCYRLVPLRDILWTSCEIDATGVVARESEDRLASGSGLFRNRNRHSTVAVDCVTWRGRKRKNTDVPDVPVGEYADIVRAEGGMRLKKKKKEKEKEKEKGVEEKGAKEKGAAKKGAKEKGAAKKMEEEDEEEDEKDEEEDEEDEEEDEEDEEDEDEDEEKDEENVEVSLRWS